MASSRPDRAVPSGVQWPGGARFAFTIFDDTDCMTVENGRPVYDLLTGLGFRITKSVWMLPPGGPPRTGGSDCSDPAYLEWVRELQAQGHEIGLHDVSDHSSRREETERGLDLFRHHFGQDPRCLAHHSRNRESLYFGADRVSGAARAVYRVATRDRWRGRFQGHVPDSEYFWGDLSRERVRYVRNFVYRDIDTLRSCPMMPYHDPRRPYVRSYFASSAAPEPESFASVLSEEAQDRLVDRGGLCILYTHLGVKFCSEGRLDPRFERLMTRLAAQGGWFAPVGEVLGFLEERNGGLHQLTDGERRRLEWRWLGQKLREGKTS